MFSRIPRLGPAVLTLLAVAAPALAQTDPDIPRQPKTPNEFWRALQFEVAVGKYDLAAQYLKGLLASNPTDKDYVAIEEKEGISSFLRLRNVEKWSDNLKLNTDAKQNVEDLISKATEAVRRFRTDPERIARFTRNLSASPEEREYAFNELLKSGAAIMPHFIATLMTADGQDRATLLGVLPKLGPETVPPLLAALSVEKPMLQLDLMAALAQRPDVLSLQNRTESNPVPVLWHLSTLPAPVGSNARDLLGKILNKDADHLGSPVAALTRSADDMYQHKATFSKSTDDQTVWTWDGRQLRSARLKPTDAEESYGLRDVKWALAADPENEDAQVVFLSLITEKAYERMPLDTKLAKGAPSVHELLSLAPASVLYTALDRAMTQGHTSVALGIVQALGERAEFRGGRSPRSSAGAPRNQEGLRTAPDPLVKALNSQDRRVAMAAADALIRLPGFPTHAVSARIVEVYRAALANAADGGGGHPKALIADADQVRAELLASTIRQAGYDSVVVHTGRDALKRLNQAADIDMIWAEHDLPYPGLAPFIAQVRSDFRYGRLPVFVTLSDDVRKSILPELETRLSRLLPANPEIRLVEKNLIRVEMAYDAYKLSPGELEDWLKQLAHDYPKVRATRTAALAIRIDVDYKDIPPELHNRIKEVVANLPGVNLTQQAVTRYTITLDGTQSTPPQLEDRLARFSRDFTETRVTREMITRLVLTSIVPADVPLDVEAKVRAIARNYRGVQVVNRPFTPDAVREELAAAADVSSAPLTEAERKDFQKRAISALRDMAVGALPGYDVKPAAPAIRGALAIDDLAPYAIEALSHLPGAESQQALARLVLDAKRLAKIRAQAATELARHIQMNGPDAVTDAQIREFLQLYDVEKNPEFKGTLVSLLGVLPRSRVLAALPDDAARRGWLSKAQTFKPSLGPVAPPTAPPPKPIDEGKE